MMPIAMTKAEASACFVRQNILHMISHLERTRTGNDLWPAISHLRAAYDQLDKFQPSLMEQVKR